MADRVSMVIASVFGVDASAVTDEDSPDSIDGWDSMNHLKLVMALEGEFEISLSPSESEEMLSVKLIRMILAEKGVRSER